MSRTNEIGPEDSLMAESALNLTKRTNSTSKFDNSTAPMSPQYFQDGIGGIPSGCSRRVTGSRNAPADIGISEKPNSRKNSRDDKQIVSYGPMYAQHLNTLPSYNRPKVHTSQPKKHRVSDIVRAIQIGDERLLGKQVPSTQRATTRGDPDAPSQEFFHQRKQSDSQKQKHHRFHK